VLLYSLLQFASRQDIGARIEETISAKTRTAKKEALLERTPTALFILRFAAVRGRHPSMLDADARFSSLAP
jgi:hypothetical protein